ncbi:MAG: hypothetical protein WC091_14085, partial [Sulfuricellaceae bacterium]
HNCRFAQRKTTYFVVSEEYIPKTYLHSVWRLNRARPTNGSGRGSLRDHDLTLIGMHFSPLRFAHLISP